MKNEFEYFGFWVAIEARRPTPAGSDGLWLADVRYRFGEPSGYRDIWATLNRGAQTAYSDPETAIAHAVDEVRAHLDHKIQDIREGRY